MDSAWRVGIQDHAAFIVLYSIKPTSVRLNRQFGGSIYKNGDVSYATTNPIKGDAHSVAFDPFLVIPPGTFATAIYHTHGAADPRYLNEQFSPQDVYSARYVRLDAYLGTGW